jgi:hypothetical protein
MNVSSTLIVDGNVGIGASSPSSKLHVFDGSISATASSTSSAGSLLQVYNSTDGVSAGIFKIVKFGSAATTYGPFTANTTGIQAAYSNLILETETAHDFILGTTNTERMRITSAGNVGIGTSSPATKLQISGTTDTIQFQTDYAGTTGIPAGALIRTAGNSSLTFLADASSGTAGKGVTISAYSGGAWFRGLDYSNRSGTPNLVLQQDGGNVGIGTSSPDALFNTLKITAGDSTDAIWKHTYDVNWGIRLNQQHVSGSHIQWNWVDTAGNNLMSWKFGNVGIGTTSPYLKLNVTGSYSNAPTLGTASGSMLIANADGSYGMMHGVSASGWGWIQTQRVDGTGTAYNLILQPSGGNVGIGTSSPDQRLHVLKDGGGGDSAQLVKITDSSTINSVGPFSLIIGADNHYALSPGMVLTGTNSISLGVGDGSDLSNQRKLTVLSNGNVGINRTSPSYTLDVNGTITGSVKNFSIPHPLPELSETHNLIHTSIEAPTADNIYRGKVQLENGQATVNIDTHVGMTEGTFSALNGNIQVFLQNDSGWDLVRGSVSDNILTIISQNQSSTDSISWMVIGERQDQHMLDTQWTDEFGRPILEPVREPEPDIPLPEVSNENG